MFKVQQKQCKTCIYRPESPLDLKTLEQAIADQHGGFKGHRICHHSDDVCCRGFWERHKNQFQMGQIAQRLNMVEYVNIDTLNQVNDQQTKWLDWFMKKYVKKPVVIEAVQWFKNGDHPHDACSGLYSEGKIVRYYRRPEIRGGCLDGQVKCKHCDDIMHNHGWIDTLEGGHF